MHNEEKQAFLNRIVEKSSIRGSVHRALGQMIQHLREDPQPTWERDNAIIKILQKVRDHLGDVPIENSDS